MQVLFLSHHPTEILTASRICPAGARVLRKPLRRREILDALATLVKSGTEGKLLSRGDAPQAAQNSA